ncbi:unnamed protein product [Rhodiola kirilowii]
MCRMLKGEIRGVVKRAVVIGNGVAGAENQCIGLARALGLSDRYTLYRVRRPTGGVNKYLRWLPVPVHQKVDDFSRQISAGGWLKSKKVVPVSAQVNGTSDSIMEADAERIGYMAREDFHKDGPLLVVASGRDTAPVASSIKQLAAENVFVAQIQHPRMKLDWFDLVITPRHDYFSLTPQGRKQIPWFLQRWITPEPPDKHVFLTIGALHHADPPALQIAAASWHAKLAHLKKPLLVVNIGGPACHCKYGENIAKQIADYLQNVLWSCGSVRISFSRRTPQNVSNIIERKLRKHPKVCIWDGVGKNPHLANLAWADAFVITADSVSMLSEACSTGKPVYVVGAELCTWKFADFHEFLLKRGATRIFTGREDISVTWSYPPLNDTVEAANRLREALAEKGWIVKAQDSA